MGLYESQGNVLSV